ncbi:MAG TPA: large-conductance mechanosensitive channel protein MscL [Tepidisphaeraceae bacterium]|jgi:large conductance mechanosensitive channel
MATGLIREFRDFIVKGNAFDLAVGVIIGAAFGGVVKSLVDNVMMPPLGFLLGGVDFANKTIQLAPALTAGDTHPLWRYTVSKDLPATVISYGLFVNALVSLLIQGFAIFVVIKAINKARTRFQREEADAPPVAPPEDIKLLGEIRDLLKNRS